MCALHARPQPKIPDPRRWLIAAAVGVAAVIGLRFVFLPRAVPISKAERFLAGPPTFAFPGEQGRPTARCAGPPLLGIFSTTTTDVCTLTFPSGDVYNCKVFAPRPVVGAGAKCNPHPELSARRPAQGQR